MIDNSHMIVMYFYRCINSLIYDTLKANKYEGNRLVISTFLQKKYKGDGIEKSPYIINYSLKMIQKIQ